MESKLIKHAFDGYPKVRTGKFTIFETQEETQEIDYGLDEPAEVPIEAQQALPHQPVDNLQGFGDQQAQMNPSSSAQGITVQISQEDDEAGF